MTWFEILRGFLFYGKALQTKLQRECPNPNCPLKLNKAKLTQDDLIKRQKELHKRNHPNG